MRRSARRGFRLIEVIVVLAVIAILAGLMIPAPRRVREASTRMQCSNNLKQLVLGMHSYASAHDSAPPTSSAVPPVVQTDVTTDLLPTGCFGPGAAPEDRLSWAVALLPYIDQQALYQRFDVKAGYAGSRVPAGTPIKTFICPESKEVKPGDAVTNYVAMAGIGSDAATRPAGAVGNGFMGYDRLTSLKMIPDGTSNTIALMETRSGLGPWAQGGPSNLRGFDPADVPLCGDGRPFAAHKSVTQVGMLDGSVRGVHSSVEPKKLAAAITVAGGEAFDLD